MLGCYDLIYIRDINAKLARDHMTNLLSYIGESLLQWREALEMHTRPL